MNLLFRLCWLIWTARLRATCSALGPCVTPFCVMPSDLDVLRHMNNGKFFSILDLGRVDLMMRSGLARKLKNAGWYPVVAAETIEFKKSLKLFERFDVETTVIGWDQEAIFVQQRFIRARQTIATAVIRARFLKTTGGKVSAEQVLSLAGHSGPSPEIAEWIRRWNIEQAGIV